MLLYKNIVVDAVISVQNRHETCYFGPVPDVIRCVAGFALPVYDAVDAGIDQPERTCHQIVHTGDAFAWHDDRHF